MSEIAYKIKMTIADIFYAATKLNTFDTRDLKSNLNEIKIIDNRLNLLISTTESDKLSFEKKIKLIEDTVIAWGNYLVANYIQLSDYNAAAIKTLNKALHPSKKHINVLPFPSYSTRYHANIRNINNPTFRQ